MVLCMWEVSKNTGFSEERRSRSRGKQTKILKRWHKAEKERHGKNGVRNNKELKGNNGM